MTLSSIVSSGRFFASYAFSELLKLLKDFYKSFQVLWPFHIFSCFAFRSLRVENIKHHLELEDAC